MLKLEISVVASAELGRTGFERLFLAADVYGLLGA